MADPNPLVTGLLCRCPRCGRGRLFSGFLGLAPACTECGLDYASVDAGEGPAVFIILIVGVIIVGLAAVVEATIHPAPYVHLMLWIPATIVLSLALLRPFKALLVALQYRHGAGEGRLP